MAINNMNESWIRSAYLSLLCVVLCVTGCFSQEESKEGEKLPNQRQQLADLLILPQERVPLKPEYRGRYVQDGVVVEKWIWQSEPGSWVTSVLYLPEQREGPVPGVVITNGHGGSKASLYNKYTGPLLAKLGMAVLLHDAIGEEERHIEGGKGTRAHDHHPALEARPDGGLAVFSKLVWDALRAIDFMAQHEAVDSTRMAVVGNSLGGSLAFWVGALDTRPQAVMVSGYAFSPDYSKTNKRCSGQPFALLQARYGEEALLTAILDHADLLIMNGTKDEVIDKLEDGSVWHYTDSIIENAQQQAQQQNLRGTLKNWYDPEGGHRAYHHYPDNVAWLVAHLAPLPYSPEEVRALPTITLEQWMAEYGFVWPEKYRDLYWVDRHHKGAIYADPGVRPFPEQELKSLREGELGDDKYTLEGWTESVLPARQTATVTYQE